MVIILSHALQFKATVCFLQVFNRHPRKRDLASNQEAEMFRRGEVAKGNRRTFIIVNKTVVTFKRTNRSINLCLCYITAVDLPNT